MARIAPVAENDLAPSVKVAFERNLNGYETGITNMKTTLAHSLIAFEVYMQWYPLYQEIEKILGRRLAYLYAYHISKASECTLCTAFFRKVISKAGENPDNIHLTPSQYDVVNLGSCIARYQGNIADHLYNAVAKNYTEAEMVLLIAFAGQMIAMTVFNNVSETDVDEYLLDYVPVIGYH